MPNHITTVLQSSLYKPRKPINFDKSVGQLINMWLLRLNYLIYIKHLCVSNISTLLNMGL